MSCRCVPLPLAHGSSPYPLRELIYELHLPAATRSNNAIKSMHFHAYKKLRNAWRVSQYAGGDWKQGTFGTECQECAGDCLVAPST